jgi:hypothetical protein
MKKTREDEFDELLLQTFRMELMGENLEFREVVVQEIGIHLPPAGEKKDAGNQKLYDSVRLLLGSMILDAYRSPELLNLARGLILYYLRIFETVYLEKPVGSIFQSCASPTVAGRISQLFSDCLEKTDTSRDICEGEIQMWLKDRISAVSGKTAERHYKAAREKFHQELVRIAPETAQMLPGITEIHESSVTDISVRDLIRQVMRKECTLAPPCFGIELPISKCVKRTLRVNGEIFTNDFADLVNWMRDCSGFLVGMRCSGRSTLLKCIAYSIASTESEFTVYYLSLPIYLEAAERHIDVIEFIAGSILSKKNKATGHLQRNIQELRQLDHEGRLILLADDIELLQGFQQRRVIAQLASCHSVYFAISDWMKKFVVSELLLGGNAGKWLEIEMLELDANQLDRMAGNTLELMNFDKGLEEIGGYLLSNVTSLAQVPLGPLTILQCLINRRAIYPLLVAYESLSELSRRSGLDSLTFTERLVDLNLPSAAVCYLGGALYHFLKSYDFRPTDYHEYSGEGDRSAIWIPMHFIDSYLGQGNLSMSDLLRLRIVEVDQVKSCARIVFKEIELLAGAVYGFYYPARFRVNRLDRIPSGWSGGIIANMNNFRRQMPLLLNDLESGMA